MSKTLEQVTQELDSNIPRSVIAQRSAGNGMSLAYLESWYVIDRLNKVIGIGRWATDVVEMRQTFAGELAGKFGSSHHANYVSKVRLVVELPGGVQTEYHDYGYGDGQDKTNPGKAHELAVKEAVSDGLKRCARHLGMSMGLALYNKEQVNVTEDETPSKPPVEVRVQESPIQQKAAPSAPELVADPGKSHTDTLKLISNTARVVIAQRKATQDDIKARLKHDFSVETKEQLTPDQAKKFLDALTEMTKLSKRS